MKKINLYILTHLFKNFFLVFFIFLSISWILQLTRLFTVTNYIQIDILNIVYLSLFLLPNIITIIIPFIIIFGILLCFIKLNRDKELISILSLGFKLTPIKISLIIFSLIIFFFYSILNLYVAPKIYSFYKLKEFDLRNSINLDNMVHTNFMNINNNIILDFTKNGDLYEDIFISFKDEKENIIFAENGYIINENDSFNFQLSNGFKLSINNLNQVEKLEFLNYVFNINISNNEEFSLKDKNSFTIFDDINDKNFLNISFKIIDIFLLIFIIYFFYINNLKYLNLETKNNLFFLISCLFFLISNQILKNSEIINFSYLIINFTIFLIIILSTFIKNKYE